MRWRVATGQEQTIPVDKLRSKFPSDSELLRIQSEQSFDHRGRIIGLQGIIIACSEDHQSLWIGAELPEVLATELTSTFHKAPRSTSPSEPPLALERCRRLLEIDQRPLQRGGGPSYLIAPDTHFPSGVHLERSDAWDGHALRDANPGNWQPIEWDELLEGRLGPWTMAVQDHLVVSICHTPGPLTGRTAECGVWTHAAFRGRGYAAAVTSAWADVLRPSGRYLFYSTDADNLSSQRVARRLNLRPIGWTWRLGAARANEDGRVHPLSTLRHRS